MLRFPQLTVGAAGLFCPGRGGASDLEIGSLEDLASEARGLLGYLTGKQYLGEALHDIERNPFGLEYFSALALKEVCEIALGLMLPLRFDWSFPLKPCERALSYNETFYWGFDQLKQVRLIEGMQVEVEFVGGYQYRVPIEYLATWNPEDRDSFRGLEGVACRLESEGEYLTLKWSNGAEWSLDTTSILEGCEPRFSEFGSYTEDAKENIERGYAKWGPFRIFPPESE